ncbi:MAG: hypothetical protein RI949_1897 [Pseudomonadota bacterium]
MSTESTPGGQATFQRRLFWLYGAFSLGLLLFILGLGAMEQFGLSRPAMGVIFLVVTVGLYAGIGIACRTSDPSEYYVAGRRVPALFNGMATAADWLSAASFISLAGTLYLSGFPGLAFILGWTGGYCLVAVLLAPYLRKFGGYTIPDFLGARYGSAWPRVVSAAIVVICAFTYVVAQIYGVGLITTRLSGVAFEVGVFVGLGGILVCSFLGGMRAVTWTQVAQYIVLLVAYIVPVVWLSVKQTGVPVPQAVYGQQLHKVSERERELVHDVKEEEVRAHFRQLASDYENRLQDVTASLDAERQIASQRIVELKAQGAAPIEIYAAERLAAMLPKDEATATETWTKAKQVAEIRAKPLAGMPPHGALFPGDPQGNEAEQKTYNDARKNFLALVFCLMVGTAGLPHILTRYYTTPSVQEARDSVTWSLFFIFLIYCTVPALAVLVKYEIFNVLVGTPFDKLPSWVSAWTRVDPGLFSVSDVNKDGILQLGEIRLGSDMVVLATPEIGGMPFVISGLVAAGGLAAALSTADGLLLTISNALSHDVYHRVADKEMPTFRQVLMSKVFLLAVALLAALVAAQRPADIVFLVSAAFSLAAGGIFPPLVLGIFWKRANAAGATAGMVVGFGLTLYYMCTTEPGLRALLHVTTPLAQTTWWGIAPISAGVFGVPAALAVTWLVSLITPAPSAQAQRWVESLRRP